MFEKFPSLTRFSHGWTITEKLDGSNGAIIIVPITTEEDVPTRTHVLEQVNGFYVLAQSRNKLLDLTKQGDSYGFARFVHDNAEALVRTLGEGRHFGEWVGAGIQRRYDMKEKVFALFNTHRWTDVELPDRVRVVPVLAQGYLGEPGAAFAETMHNLKQWGSIFAPGFMNPEGIVMRHGPSGTLFKKTFDYDEQGKWAENQARKAG